MDIYLVIRRYSIKTYVKSQGRSQDFSKGGGGGHTGSNNIVMAFSPRNIVGCLLKKRLKKGGGGHGHPRIPLATPLNHTYIYYNNYKWFDKQIVRSPCDLFDDFLPLKLTTLNVIVTMRVQYFGYLRYNTPYSTTMPFTILKCFLQYYYT